ncbi:unnamed protein product [Cunninghamella blakesleeana]
MNKTTLPSLSALSDSTQEKNSSYFYNTQQHILFTMIPPVTTMPIIPYFFHHPSFGITSCMLQWYQNTYPTYQE